MISLISPNSPTVRHTPPCLDLDYLIDKSSLIIFMVHKGSFSPNCLFSHLDYLVHKSSEGSKNPMSTLGIDARSLIVSNYKTIGGGKEYHTSCFVCGGTDRFVIFGNTGRFWCRQCNIKGSAIDLLMQRDNMTYPDACKFVGKPLDNNRPRHRVPSPPPPMGMSASLPREQSHDVVAWRSEALKLTNRAQSYLWDVGKDGNPFPTEDAKMARDYLFGRGFDRILAPYKIGYVPMDYNANWGGLDVFISSGILISWFDEDKRYSTPFKLNVRRMKGQDPKYLMVKGSENGLFNGHRITPKTPVVLVEGEFDALAVCERTGHKAMGVATGSTMGGRRHIDIARLAMAMWVFVAFDDDEAGRKASEYWLDLLPKSSRLLPTAHDCGDMAKQGHDFNKWIYEAVKNA